MTIKWNPYPETKPPKKGDYMITLIDNSYSVDIDEYSEHDDWYKQLKCDIIAWAELPQPYEKPVRLKFKPIHTAKNGEHILCYCNGEFKSFAGDDTDAKQLKMYGWTHWAPIPEIDLTQEIDG